MVPPDLDDAAAARGAPAAAPAFRAGRLPFARASLDFLRDAFRLLAPEPGGPDLLYTSLAGIPTVFLRHPALVEEVLAQGRDAWVKDRLARRMSAFLGEGLLLAEGATWRRQRRMLNPGFQQARYASYARIMVERTEAAVARLQDGATVDVAAEMARLTLEIAVRSLLGAEVSAADAAQVSAAFGEISDYMASPLANLPVSLPLWLPLPPLRRYRRAVSSLDDNVARIVAERRRSAQEHEDLLALLLAARDEEGRALGDREVRDQMVTFLLAGHETTALGLTYALFLLGRDEARRERLRAEAEAAAGSLDAAAYPFAAQVFKEALRLHPPVYVFGRSPTVDLTIGGHPVRRGTLVALSPFMLQRDPRYFERPEEFLPERWRPELERALPPGAYFPFGLGPRKCIGVRFATLEGVLLLATLGRAVTLEPLEPRLPPLQPALTARPSRPIPVRVRRLAR